MKFVKYIEFCLSRKYRDINMIHETKVSKHYYSLLNGMGVQIVSVKFSLFISSINKNIYKKDIKDIMLFSRARYLTYMTMPFGGRT